MLQYVDDSSLGLMAKHATQKIHANGDATLALKLGIPRIRLPKPHVDYEGSLTFADNEIAYENLPPLSHVRGRASFAAQDRHARQPHRRVSSAATCAERRRASRTAATRST